MLLLIRQNQVCFVGCCRYTNEFDEHNIQSSAGMLYSHSGVKV